MVPSLRTERWEWDLASQMTLNPFQLQFSLSLQHLFLHSAPTPLHSGLLTISLRPKGEPQGWGEPTARCGPPGALALRRSRGIAGRRGRGERKGPHRPPSGRPRLAQKICLCSIQLAGHQTQGFPKGFPAISRGEGIKDCPASTLISKGRWGRAPASVGSRRQPPPGDLAGASAGCGLLRDSVSPILGNRSSPPRWSRRYSARDPCPRLGEEEQGSPSFFFSCSAACHSQARIGGRWGRDPGARAGSSRGYIPLASLAVLASGF